MRILFGLLFAYVALADGTVVGTDDDRAVVGACIAGDPPPARDLLQNSGKGDFLFTAWDGPALKIWYYLPDTFTADSTIVIVMHGNSRDGDRYRDQWSDLAADGNFIVIAPEFPRAEFPTANEYNFGYVFTSDGDIRPESSWSFSAIEQLFDAVKTDLSSNAPTYTLYGHSAGSQFVHRFLYYMPNARVSLAIAANAGWYTLPVYDETYPYGLRESGVSDAALRTAFARNVVVLLGDQDTDTEGSSLRQTPEAMRQGSYRFARGRYFFETSQRAAQQLDAEFNWSLVEVPGADHDNGKMAVGAAPLIQ